MKKITYLLGLLTWLISCESINFDDPSTLTNEEAIQKLNHYGLEIHRLVFDYKSFEFRPRSIKSKQLKLRSLKYRLIPG